MIFFNRMVACWGVWVGIHYPLWMTAELEVPGQQYADPLVPIYLCSWIFAVPTFALMVLIGVWREVR